MTPLSITTCSEALARAKRQRLAAVIGTVALQSGFAWFVVVAPALVGFGFAVTAAVAWCIWLERHPM